jgi:hypothetical protein
LPQTTKPQETPYASREPDRPLTLFPFLIVNHLLSSIYLYIFNLITTHPIIFFILSPQSGIVLGRQSTAMRRRCALDELAINSNPRKVRQALSAQPPHDGALPAVR